MKKLFYSLFEFSFEVEFPILYFSKSVFYLRIVDCGDDILAFVLDYHRNELLSFRVLVKSRSIQNVDIKSFKDFRLYSDELIRFSPAISIPCRTIDSWKRYISASLRVYLDMNLL